MLARQAVGFGGNDTQVATSVGHQGKDFGVETSSERIETSRPDELCVGREQNEGESWHAWDTANRVDDVIGGQNADRRKKFTPVAAVGTSQGVGIVERLPVWPKRGTAVCFSIGALRSELGRCSGAAVLFGP